MVQSMEQGSSGCNESFLPEHVAIGVLGDVTYKAKVRVCVANSVLEQESRATVFHLKTVVLLWSLCRDRA